jgi:hypothetical protein
MIKAPDRKIKREVSNVFRNKELLVNWGSWSNGTIYHSRTSFLFASLFQAYLLLEADDV